MSQLQNEEHSTFKVVYVDHPASGPTTTITFQQKPPNWRIMIGQGLLLQTNGKNYYCAQAAGRWTCFQGPTSTPFAAMIGLFNPAVIVSELKAIQGEVTLKEKGVTVTSSSKTIAGQSAACETVKTKSGSGTWCVDGKGYLAYASGTGGYIQLQSYTTAVSSSGFSLPAGAKVTKLP